MWCNIGLLWVLVEVARYGGEKWGGWWQQLEKRSKAQMTTAVLND